MKMNETNKHILPYNLQFFAEANPEPTPEPAPASDTTTNSETTSEPQLTAEEQLAKALAEAKKLKAAMDKAASEAADWKKKYRATLDEKERLDLEKAEREAQLQTEYEQLKRENTINKMAKSFIGMGYTEEQAIKAAEAQLDGDFEEFTRIQNAFLTARDKQKEAEWMKKMPTPPAGHGEGDKIDPFIAGFDKG
jgi:hypothetical protein